MKLKWLGSTFLFSALAFGCGGGDGGGFGSPTEAINASIDQTCSVAFECRDSFPPDQGFQFEDLFGNTEAECQTNIADVFDADALEASVDAGRVIFDGDDAATCLDAAADITCDQFWGIDDTFQDSPTCDTAFIGTVADGGTCTIDDDCSNSASSCDEELLVCGP